MATQSLARAFASTRGVLVNIKPSQFEDSTPCKSWNVRALINHVVGAPRFAASAIATGEGTVAEQDFTAGDLLSHYDETANGALEAFGSAGALEKTVTLPFAEVPGAFLMMMVSTDQFTHGWDLARATGQSTNLDPDLAAQLLAQVQQSLTDDFRGDDGVAPFGPRLEAPAGACPADQLAAFLGRSV
jgi:uncharacterized protein (TIGR03086 family)